MNTVKVTGNLFQRNGKYIIIVSWYENGRRKQQWHTTEFSTKGNNKRKAKEKQNQLIAEKEQQLLKLAESAKAGNGQGNDILFADFLLNWLDVCKLRLASNTYESYSLAIKKQVEPYFRKKKLLLSEITAAEIQQYHAQRLRIDKVSGNTIRHHQAYIGSALEYAVKNQYIPYNPARAVVLPRQQKYEAQFYSADDIKELLKAVQGTSVEAPVTLTAYYGFRRSEVLALRWDVIDFKNNTISVLQKAVYTHDEDGNCKVTVTSDLKTKASRRTLPLIQPAKKYLLELRKRQQENQKKWGNVYNYTYTGYICVTEKGDLIKPDYLTRQFQKVIKANGLKPIRFHDLRHSCASLMLSSGVSLKEIQLWLGHSNFQTTADIYSHLTYQDKLSAAQKLEMNFAAD